MKRVKELVHYNFDEISKKKWLGNDVVIAVLDTGVALHSELKGQVIAFRDFVNGHMEMYDDNGHGTHVCGIIAGKRIGMAPQSKIIVLKVLDATGDGKVEQCMRGFRWIIENRERYGIRIVNISIGMQANKNILGERYILGAVEMLWNLGLVVVAAAGNFGPKEGSITIPGINEKIITVGSSDDDYSGRGSMERNMWKPDIVVPGTRIFSCNAKYGKKNEKYYIAKSGTSMATPVVSGAIANLLSKNPEMTNKQIKEKIKLSCDDLGMEEIRQGKGILNMEKLLY